MPMLSQGSSVNVTVTGDSTLVIQNAGGWARVESPVGRIIAEGGRQPPGLSTLSGIARITAITGNLYYEVTVDPSLVEATGSATPASICFFGDSTTQPRSARWATNCPVRRRVRPQPTRWVDNDCPSGAGTLTGTPRPEHSKTGLRSASAPGCRGCLGEQVRRGSRPVSRTGAVFGLVWRNSASTTATSTVTVQVNGFQVWVTRLARTSFRQWPVCSGDTSWRPCRWLPPGMDGIYGLGGSGSQELLAAYPQWSFSPIRCDVAVLQIGTNDIAGA